MKKDLMDGLKSRRLWFAVFSCLLFCLGIHFYTQWDLARFEAELPKVPQRDTSDTPAETESSRANPETDTPRGHFHEDGTFHAAPHVGDMHATDSQPLSTGEYKPPANWDELPLEERQRLWAEAYRAKWGDDPSFTGEYRHTHDEHGRLRRHYRNRPLLTHYDIRVGFVPPPGVLQHYLKLQADVRSAKDAGDTHRAEALMAEMQQLALSHQGAVPVRPYGFAFYGDKLLSDEEDLLLEAEATRELYELMGIEHLYEFYEGHFYNNP